MLLGGSPEGAVSEDPVDQIQGAGRHGQNGYRIFAEGCKTVHGKAMATKLGL